MNIFFLRSNPISPDPRVEKEAFSLMKAGFSVEALGWDRTGELPERENREGIIIHRLPIKAAFGSGMRNLPALLHWQWGLLGRLLAKRKDYEIIHACDFDTVLPALWMKFFHKKIVIYDIFDFYADHLRSTPDFIKWLIRKVDLWVMGKADGVILVDDSRKVQIQQAKVKNLQVIYNTPKDYQPEISKGTKQEESRLKLVFVGMLQVERGLLELLMVLKDNPQWHLDLAGFGGDEDRILAVSSSLKNVSWHGRISYQKALELSHKADVLIATYDPSIPNHRYSSPNKIFEAMMLGKPVIVARNTNMDRIIEKYDCGIVVDYGDQEALSGALSRLADDVELRTRLGKNARAAYEDEYSWKKMEDRLLELYRTVIDAKSLKK